MPRLQYFQSSNSRCGVHKAACKYIAQVQSARNGCFPLCNMGWRLFADRFCQTPFHHLIRKAADRCHARRKRLSPQYGHTELRWRSDCCTPVKQTRCQGIASKQVCHFVKSILSRFCSGITFCRNVCKCPTSGN